MKKVSIWNNVIKMGCILLLITGVIYFVLGLFMEQQTFLFGGSYALSFLIVFFTLFCCLFLYARYNKQKDIANEHTPLNECVHIFDDYIFLLKQLITRDFAVKYRRSYLGIVWVILNPLLQMIILSAVFSFIFRFSRYINRYCSHNI